MQKILFLCTGNTCRSPMAEYLFKHIVSENNFDIYVESRGLYASGEKISSNASTVLKNVYNITNTNLHISRKLDINDLDNFDLILAMTNNHKLSINNKAYNNKIFTLSEYATGEILDIVDPYGQDILAYERCIKQIEEYLNLICLKKGD